MELKRLGKTGFMISPIIYGGIVSMHDGQDASDRYVDWALERGINYYDVAPVYDDAQEKLGNSLVGKRNGIYLACKTTGRTYEAGEKDMTESFRLLHTDYFDNYQLHAVSTIEEIDTAFGPKGLMEYLVKAKKDGKIRNIGITGHNEDAIIYALSLYDFDTVMYPMNWNISMGKHHEGDRLGKLSKEKCFGLLGMKTLIERAWKTTDERYSSRFPKSWCKPIDTAAEPSFGIAAMRYSYSMGSDVLVTPGNFESFSFAIDHLEDAVSPFTDADQALLNEKINVFGDKPFLLPDGTMVYEYEK